MKLSLFIILSLSSLSLHALECDLKSHKELGAEILKELDSNLTCSLNPVHLSFESGPSTTVTPAILKELALRQVKASFFVTTSKINSVTNSDIVAKAMDQGHLIGSNGHEHKSYALRMDSNDDILETGLSQPEREEQIQTSIKLLNQATKGRFGKQTPMLFRLPYGRGAMPSGKELKAMISNGDIVLEGRTYADQLKEYRQISPALQTLAGHNFSHLGWNLDSGDSDYGVKAPNKEEVKAYILKNIHNLCGQPKMTKVAIFSDSKEINASAIPVILDIGKCLGIQFISAQAMAKDTQLSKFGVLIEKESIKIENVKQVIAGLDNAKKVGVRCEDTKPDKLCSSSDGRNYKSCQGEDSICFEGRWYAKSDPLIKNNCK